MTFRTIAFGSDDYRRIWELRETVLRKPLGLTLAAEDLEAERDHLHYGLFDAEETLAGSVIAVPLEPGIAKLSQMAIAPDFSGRGYGAQILRELEADLRSCGFHRVILHARSAVAGFSMKNRDMPSPDLNSKRWAYPICRWRKPSEGDATAGFILQRASHAC